MYFTAGEVEYWYEVYGKGIPLVLLHGFTGSTRTWEDLIAGRPDGFQLIAVDLPGHGKTSNKQVISMAECVNGLHALFQHLKLEDFFLLGYSMGGRTALSYAVQYPDTLQGLLLESASPGLREASARKERQVRDKKLAVRLEEEGVARFVNFWENIPLFDSQKQMPESMQEKVSTERLSQTSEGLAGSLRGMGTGSQVSNWDALESLPMPVLLLAGALDEKFVQINKEIETLLPQGNLEIIPDAGHAVHLEAPAAFREAVIEFAKTHAP